MKLSRLSIIGVLVAGVCLVPVYWVLFNIPRIEDARRCSGLWHYVTNKFTFQVKSEMDPLRPAFYVSPLRNSARLSAYGITNTDQQDELVFVVKTWQTTNQNMSKLNVRFYERENWSRYTNEQAGVSGGSRLPEVLLREVTVK